MAEKYEIGYGKPPKNSQFKPGQSGNKKGRPKGSKNSYSIIKEILDQKITIKENGKEIRISKKAAIFVQFINKTIKGDNKSFATLLPHILGMEMKEEDREQILAALNQDDREIIQTYLTNYDGAEELAENETE